MKIYLIGLANKISRALPVIEGSTLNLHQEAKQKRALLAYQLQLLNPDPVRENIAKLSVIAGGRHEPRR